MEEFTNDIAELESFIDSFVVSNDQKEEHLKQNIDSTSIHSNSTEISTDISNSVNSTSIDLPSSENTFYSETRESNIKEQNSVKNGDNTRNIDNLDLLVPNSSGIDLNNSQKFIFQNPLMDINNNTLNNVENWWSINSNKVNGTCSTSSNATETSNVNQKAFKRVSFGATKINEFQSFKGNFAHDNFKLNSPKSPNNLNKKSPTLNKSPLNSPLNGPNFIATYSSNNNSTKIRQKNNSHSSAKKNKYFSKSKNKHLNGQNSSQTVEYNKHKNNIIGASSTSTKENSTSESTASEFNLLNINKNNVIKSRRRHYHHGNNTTAKNTTIFNNTIKTNDAQATWSHDYRHRDDNRNTAIESSVKNLRNSQNLKKGKNALNFDKNLGNSSKASDSTDENINLQINYETKNKFMVPNQFNDPMLLATTLITRAQKAPSKSYQLAILCKNLGEKIDEFLPALLGELQKQYNSRTELNKESFCGFSYLLFDLWRLIKNPGTSSRLEMLFQPIINIFEELLECDYAERDYYKYFSKLIPLLPKNLIENSNLLVKLRLKTLQSVVASEFNMNNVNLAQNIKNIKGKNKKNKNNIGNNNKKNYLRSLEFYASRFREPNHVCSFYDQI